MRFEWQPIASVYNSGVKMTTINKKDEERIFLVKTLKKAGLDFEIKGGARETPDFVVIYNGMPIGVEVTTLYRTLSPGENAKKLEATIGDIITKSLEIYSSLGGPPIIAQIVLDGTKPVINKKSFTKNLANRLFLDSAAIHQGDMPADFCCVSVPSPDFSPIIELVITTSPTRESCMLVISKFNSIEVSAADISSVISKKSIDTNRYPSNIAEKWLIIVLPFMAMAGDLVLQDNVCTPNGHNFNRIYLYDLCRDKLAVVGACP